MIDGLRQKLNEGGRFGIGLVAAGVLVAIFVAVIVFRNNTGPSDAARHANNQAYICTETGKTYFHTLKAGESFPLHSPHSGKKTGYPADQCWWTKEGTLRSEPFYLLRNVYLGERGPTFCPDCGRMFTPEVGAPTADMTAPPTREEYLKSRPGGQSSTSSGDES